MAKSTPAGHANNASKSRVASSAYRWHVPLLMTGPSVRRGVKGPRSFTRTTTVLPVRGLPTTRQVPKRGGKSAAVLSRTIILSSQCPLLALLRHSRGAVQCPKFTRKRTSRAYLWKLRHTRASQGGSIGELIPKDGEIEESIELRHREHQQT
jgi:hypothetical protein